MTKQNIHAALQTLISNASFKFTGKYINSYKAGSRARLRPSRLYQAVTIFYTIFQQSFAAFGAKVMSVLTLSVNKQIVAMDKEIREGSCLYPYNFTGSPHLLFLLPNFNTQSIPNKKPSVQAIAGNDQHFIRHSKI